MGEGGGQSQGEVVRVKEGGQSQGEVVRVGGAVTG